MMRTIEETREYMRKMEDSGQYRFYGEKIDDIPDDQVVDRYMRTRLRLFLEWGITFEEEHRVEEQSARRVYYADQNALTRAIVRKYPPKLTERQTTRSVKGEGQLHDAPVQEMVVAEDIDYDRMPHKRTPYNLPRKEVDR